MKNLLLIFMLLFAVDSIAQLDQREKGDVVSPALNKNPNFIQKTGWTIEAIDPINDTLCSVTPGSDNLSIETADVCNARVYQDINSADIRKARFAKETMTVALKIQSMGYVKITLNVYKKAATSGTLTLLRTRSLENNSGVLLRNKKIVFDVVTEDLNFVTNANLADSLRIEFTFEPTVVFPAGVAEVAVNDFRVFSSLMNYSPVLYNVNQTQSETLLSVGDLTQTTDLTTFTKEDQTGSGIYTLSTAGITFLRDANVTIRVNIISNTSSPAKADIYVNGGARSYIETPPSGTSYKGGSAILNMFIKSGDKVTFASSGTTSNNINLIQILATVSVPAVATNKYREPVTKYLSSDITATTADIADLKFTDLVVGDRYILTASAFFEFSTDVAGENKLESSQGDLIILRNSGSAGNTASTGSAFSQVTFTATSPTLSFSYVRSAHNLVGTGSATGSYVSLKRIDSVMQAYLLESNIEKDVTARYIVKTFQSGNNWYEVCNDGWVRQAHSLSSGSGVSVTHTYTIPFLNSSYSLSVGNFGGDNATAFISELFYTSKNSTGFTYIRRTTSGKWYVAEGYGNADAVRALGANPDY